MTGGGSSGYFKDFQNGSRMFPFKPEITEKLDQLIEITLRTAARKSS